MQVNAIMLRSGIVLEEVEQKGKDENPPEKKEESEEEVDEEIIVEERPTSPRKEEPNKEKMSKQKKEKMSFPKISSKLMSSYAKFLKEILSNKRMLEEDETVMLTNECSAILQNNVNLMPLSVFKKLGIGEVKLTMVSLQLADQSIKYPLGIVEDMFVRVDKFIIPADFVMLDMEEDKEIPLILG
ncbi:uncharacterized protein LOC116142728 [Pistacia vera]|uniref:uncharacterized protein LOC116142728 n=1 Tax=Pistacia vera TaxID=55513 RepID=UPI001262B692|nr:uncharacterized protein LOC116142728 [Pistacia vera]